MTRKIRMLRLTSIKIHKMQLIKKMVRILMTTQKMMMKTNLLTKLKKNKKKMPTRLTRALYRIKKMKLLLMMREARNFMMFTVIQTKVKQVL